MSQTLPNVPPNATPDFQNSVLNQVIDYINQQQRTQVISDGTTNRYLSGYQKGGWAGGDFGMKISAPNNDVTNLSATLLFSWDYTTNQQITYNKGVATILIGSAPVDQRSGVWVAASGKNVITQLGG